VRIAASQPFPHALDHYTSMSGQPFNVGLSDANLSKLELRKRIRRQVPAFVFLKAQLGDQNRTDVASSTGHNNAFGHDLPRL